MRGVISKVFKDRIGGIMMRMDSSDVTHEEKETKIIFSKIDLNEKNIIPVPKYRLVCRYFIDGSRKQSGPKLVWSEDGNINAELAVHQISACCCKKDESGSIAVENNNSDILISLTPKVVLNKAEMKEAINRINEEIDGSPVRICNDGILSNKKERNNNVNKRMTELERSIAKAILKKCNENELVVVDGPLGINTAYFEKAPDRTSNLIGIIKKTKVVATAMSSLIQKLEAGQRTPVSTCHIAKGPNTDRTLIRWYLKLRDDKPFIIPHYEDNISPNVIGCDMILPCNADIDVIVNNVSAAILNEINPTCYGLDKRWDTHLYPIYLTEKACKNMFYKDDVIDYLI